MDDWSAGAAVGMWKRCLCEAGAGGWVAQGHGMTVGGGSVLTRPAAPPRRRSDASITCTVPGGALPALVPVCVRFEQRGCVRGGLSFQYMPNPVITAISPHRSHVR